MPRANSSFGWSRQRSGGNLLTASDRARGPLHSRAAGSEDSRGHGGRRPCHAALAGARVPLEDAGEAETRGGAGSSSMGVECWTSAEPPADAPPAAAAALTPGQPAPAASTRGSPWSAPGGGAAAARGARATASPSASASAAPTSAGRHPRCCKAPKARSSDWAARACALMA
ncbi:unnamed protein product [Prorocentrum cordatum]|uniref:Uncharacterized protein n=1 Tax=Prorocentrum cordatum TaxID=2364126 RepID=A0ABN9PQ96_9DINO|nr:unnamed protein product [Polarella glacialis]